MKKLLSTLAAAMLCLTLGAQGLVIDLWPNGAPNDNGLTGPETQLENGRIGNVSHPTLTVYPAAKPNGMVLIACPGGGYVRLAPNHEGHDMAAWLNNLGITLAVLKYRMPNGNIEVPISDALQAVKLLRERANEWGIDPKKVGIMGASAGGNLTAQASTHYTSEADRPDFQVLFYPAMEIKERGARNMLGDNYTKALIDKYTPTLQVTAQTPPAFILCSADDPTVDCQNSINYFTALRAKGVQATLHIYPEGRHGWGYLDTFPYKYEWTAELERWLSRLYQ